MDEAAFKQLSKEKQDAIRKEFSEVLRAEQKKRSNHNTAAAVVEKQPAPQPKPAKNKLVEVLDFLAEKYDYAVMKMADGKEYTIVLKDTHIITSNRVIRTLDSNGRIINYITGEHQDGEYILLYNFRWDKNYNLEYLDTEKVNGNIFETRLVNAINHINQLLEKENSQYKKNFVTKESILASLNKIDTNFFRHISKTGITFQNEEYISFTNLIGTKLEKKWESQGYHYDYYDYFEYEISCLPADFTIQTDSVVSITPLVEKMALRDKETKAILAGLGI